MYNTEMMNEDTTVVDDMDNLKHLLVPISIYQAELMCFHMPSLIQATDRFFHLVADGILELDSFERDQILVLLKESIDQAFFPKSAHIQTPYMRWFNENK